MPNTDLDADSPRGGETVYCTITSLGYLPRAVALARSVRVHEPDRRMVVLVFDVVDGTPLPVVDGIDIRSWDFLGLPLREYLELATYYKAYELATTIKPLFALRLLDEVSGVVFLDSDTKVFSPLVELEPLLAEHATVLTPHLSSATEDPSWIEILVLKVGAFNLGFGAFSREARPFLEWWWQRTRMYGFAQWHEGMWCDQKWVDVGAAMFPVVPLRHPGYNVAWWNLYARPLAAKEDGTVGVAATETLRMFHFSDFRPREPESIVAKAEEFGPLSVETKTTLVALAKSYADDLATAQRELGVDNNYRLDHDTTGRALSSTLR